MPSSQRSQKSQVPAATLTPTISVETAPMEHPTAATDHATSSVVPVMEVAVRGIVSHPERIA